MNLSPENPHFPLSETVLITGASSGLGREFAELFAADRSQLVLVARNQSRLLEVARELERRYDIACHVLPADLSDLTAVPRLISQLEDRGLQVDVLVNNAGVGTVGSLIDTPLERQFQMIHVNVTSLVALTHGLLPGMLERQRGGILNVSSTAAFSAGPNMAVYYATKAFVQSFSEALHEETDGTPVVVTSLAAGATATGFGKASGMQKSEYFEKHAMDPRLVAVAGYRAFRDGLPIVVPGLRNRLSVFSTRLLPRSWTRRIVKRLKTFE